MWFITDPNTIRAVVPNAQGRLKRSFADPKLFGKYVCGAKSSVDPNFDKSFRELVYWRAHSNAMGQWNLYEELRRTHYSGER